ncbi:MAG TPA: M36 family metallopeptidase [Phycisphaerales bacterium]|nr:M36 family metallopeptidase [Phycisphaerales bacterium]
MLGTSRVVLTTRSAGLCLSLAAGLTVAAPRVVAEPLDVTSAAAAHAAHCSQCNHGEGLPNFDIRVDDAVIRAVAETSAQAAAAKARAAAAPLIASVRGLAVDFDESLGTVKFLRTTEGFLTAQRPGAPWGVVAGDFIAANRGLVGFDAAELTRNRVPRDFVTRHNGVRSVTVQQVHEGVDVFEAIARLSVTSRGELVNLSSTMIERPAGGFVVEAPKLSAARAVMLAAADAGVTVSEDALAVAEAESGVERRTVWRSPLSLRADEPLVTKLVYFPLTRDTLVPAWAVVVPQHGAGHTYDTLIDATDGKVLHRTDRLLCAAPITMRVFTGDSPAPMSPGLPSPVSTQASQVTRDLITINPQDVQEWSPQGWIPDGTFETIGNNVAAHTDADGNNSADLPRPSGGASLTFDFGIDLTQPPSAYRDAAVTQMFYLCNKYHDRLYALGFDEPAGNYQNDNFGNGGAGGDRIQADVQDSSSTNNANFGTSGNDGTGGRVQMFVWTSPNPDRDGALESDIVYHELTHGTSIRLHGTLSQSQSAGMGEGWSDFVALSINAQPGDDPDAIYTMGPYALYQYFGMTSNYYFGIRRYPYTTNMNKGPLTFGDIDPALYNVPGSVPRSPASTAANNDVHDHGEVWCQILWECRAGMIHAHGFAGNEMMLQLVIDAMKLAPANPTFIQSRDAILNADAAANGGANAGILWTAFARRGIGTGASAPAASTVSGVVESFVSPIFTTFTFPDGLPAQLSPVTGTPFRVNVTGTGLSVTDDSGRLSYRVDDGAFQTVPMLQTGPGQYLATLPAQPCMATVDYYVTVGTSEGDRTSPASAPSAFAAAKVFTSVLVVASDSFESPSGWTTGPDTATTGGWVRVDPIGTTAQPGDDHTGAPGIQCFVTGQGPVGGGIGDADIDNGQVILNSPVYDLASVGDATVSYWRWYSNGTSAAPFSDVFRVQVSTNNGGSWTAAETVGPANTPDTNPGWRFAAWSLSSLGLTPTSQVKVRFIAEDAGSGSLVEAAVDDFTITGLLCEGGPAACGPADLGVQGGMAGHDGVLDNNDFVAFIDAFFSQAPAADVGVQGGMAGSDGAFDNNDFVVFIDLFFAGCP